MRLPADLAVDVPLDVAGRRHFVRAVRRPGAGTLPRPSAVFGQLHGRWCFALD